MCGIVGYLSAFSNGFSHTEADAFKDLLFLDTLRGQDSTGVYGVDKHGNVSIAKKAVTGGEFIKTKEFRDFASDSTRSGVFMVGHNRAATRGTVNDVNAHPFWVDDKIILVHNGTMRNDHKKHADVEVDSHAIAHALSKDDDIEKVLQGINAAYALAWYNVEQKTLRVLRNDERPMHMARTKVGGLMFASELEFILFAAHRNRIELKETPFMLAAHHLCEYTLDGKGNWTVAYRDVDTKYRYQTGDTSYWGDSFRGNNCEGYGEGYESSYRNWVNRTTREIVNEIDEESAAEAARERFKQSKKAIKHQFSDYLINHRREKWFTQEEAEKAIEYASALHAQKTCVVEIEDYVPCNEHPDCDTWYVYGTPVDPNHDDSFPAPIIFWIKAGYDKEQILAYSAHGFYRVDVQPRQTIMFKDQEEKAHSIVMAFGSNSVPAVTNTAEMNVS